MKYLYAILLLVLVTGYCRAQSLDIDLRRDFYGIASTVDMSVLDTIVICPVNGNFDQKRNIFLWRYLGGNDYQLKIFENSMPGADGNFEHSPERWKLKENEGEYYLVVRDHKDPKPFHRKLAVYRLFPKRDDHNILLHITMVRVYDKRFTEHLKTPSLRN